MKRDDHLTWKLSPFESLSGKEVYDMLQLRSEVFVMEQNCPFMDADGTDSQAIHLLGYQKDKLVAYARCFPAGVKFSEASIGRVVTSAAVRGTGLGHKLIDEAVRAVTTTWGPQPIRIGAQARLEAFYVGHGFVNAGIPYVEDGIDHLEMTWQP